MSTRFVLLLGGMLVLAAAIYAAVFAVSDPQTIAVGAPGDGFFVANMFSAEPGPPPFRWSTRASTLRLPRLAAGPLLLSARLHGTGVAGGQLVQWSQGETTVTTRISGDWRVIHLLLPAQPQSMFETFAPVLVSSQTAPPSATEPRDLGVVIDRVQFRFGSHGMPGTAAVWWSIGMAWALALHAGVARAAGIARWATAAAVLLLALVTGALLWFRPLSVAWLMPGAAGLLLVGTAMLVLWRFGGAVRGPNWRGDWRLGAAGVLLLHGVLLLPLPLALRGAAACALLLAPGALFAGVLLRESDMLARWFVALCGGVALWPLLLLALHALPGPLPWWLALLAVDVLIAAALVFRRRIPPVPHARSDAAPHPRGLLAAVLLLAAAVRLPGLGSAEFQGDEARAMVLASGVLHGQDGALLLHTKGPIEALLPAGPLVLLGQINEWVARLPFAVSGLAAILGVYLLARRMFPGAQGTWIGLAAGLLLALDGFLIGFARIVQYQSVVLLMLVGAAWCCWRVYEGVHAPRRWLVAAAVLAAVGLLGHYDALSGLPVLAWLVLAAGRRHRWSVAHWFRVLAAPLMLAAALVAAFYVPFVLSPHFAQTAAYLFGRTRREDVLTTFFNNLPGYFEVMTFYNTVYVVLGLAAMGAAAVLVWLLRLPRPRGAGFGLAALWALACAVLLLVPGRFVLPNGVNWAIFAFGLPLAGLALLPGTPFALRTALIWFAVPFIGESFLIADPRTHYYTMHLPAALLLALAGAHAVAWLRARRTAWLLRGLGAACCGVLALAGAYAWLAFVQPQPEYFRTFPAARPALFRAPWGDEVPKGGYFGFPHQDGLKVVGELYRRGVLHGSYNSNQKSLVTGWYTGGVFQCDKRPAYYFLALNEPGNAVPAGYHLFGAVELNGMRTMDVYSRAPVDQPRMFALDAATVAAFDQQPVGSFPLEAMLGEAEPQQCGD